MGEQAAVVIRDPPLGRANSPSPAQDNPFRLNCPRFRGDRSHERDLEFQRCLPDARIKSRLHGEAHAAIEQRRRKPAMHRTSRVEQAVIGLRDDNDTPVRGLCHIVAEGRATIVLSNAPLASRTNSEATHRSLTVCANRSVEILASTGRIEQRLPWARRSRTPRDAHCCRPSAYCCHLKRSRETTARHVALNSGAVAIRRRCCTGQEICGRPRTNEVVRPFCSIMRVWRILKWATLRRWHGNRGAPLRIPARPLNAQGPPGRGGPCVVISRPFRQPACGASRTVCCRQDHAGKRDTSVRRRPGECRAGPRSPSHRWRSRPCARRRPAPGSPS